MVVKLGEYIEKVHIKATDIEGFQDLQVYGVSNKEGITITSHKVSEDLSKYLYIDENCFAYNPYRINVGSIGLTPEGISGLVSPAYVVFKTKKGKLHPKLLIDFLKSPDGLHEIAKYARGTVRKALRYKELCEIEIPEISYEKQLNAEILISKIKKKLNPVKEELTNQSSYLSKLRQAILQEAIEGKLTADWRKENPVRKGAPDFDAEALLKNLKAEKEKLIKEGKIKKQKPLAPIKPEEVPFELPEGWVWTRLGEIIKNPPRNGYSPKAVSYESEVKTLKLGATTWGTFNPAEFKYIDEKIDKDSVFWLKNNDVLIQRSNSIDYVGVSAIYTGKDDEFIYPDLMMKLETVDSISVKYFHKAISSPFNREYFRKNAKGAQKSMPKINQGIVNNTLIPLPPIAEQKAIDVSVEKFLAMVDKLVTQVSERKKQSELLMQAVIREAFEGKKNA